MKPDNPIDRIFTPLSEGSITPPEASWLYIASALDRKRKRRKRLIVWWVAAAILVGLGRVTYIATGANSALNPDPNTRVAEHTMGSSATTGSQSQANSTAKVKTLTNSKPKAAEGVAQAFTQERIKEKKTSATKLRWPSVMMSPIQPSKAVAAAQTQRSVTVNPQPDIKIGHANQKDITNPTVHQLEVSPLTVTAPSAPMVLAVTDPLLDTPPNALLQWAQQIDKASKAGEKSEKEVKKTDKWLVGPVFNPSIHNAFGSDSPIDPRFANNSKQFKMASTFGVQVQWAVNERFGLRSGIHQAQLEFSTQNVYLSESFETTQLAHLNANGLTYVQLSGSSGTPSALNKNGNTGIEAQLTQRFRFIEIPLEGVYVWKHHDWLLQISGGLSTYVLQENRVYVDSPAMTMTLGEASNVNKWHYSGNIGIGLGYEIMPKVVLGLEPYFKYQWNTYDSSTTGFTPYTLGSYFGVKYRF